MAGYNPGLIQAFLEQLGHGRWQAVTVPTMGGFLEYIEDAESEYYAQVGWDARQHNSIRKA